MTLKEEKTDMLYRTFFVITFLLLSIQSSFTANIGSGKETPQTSKELELLKRSLQAKSSETIHKIKLDLIQSRDFLQARRYRIHRSYSSLIELIDNGLFKEDLAALRGKLDNLYFYVNSVKGMNIVIVNRVTPYLTKGMDLIDRVIRREKKLLNSERSLLVSKSKIASREVRLHRDRAETLAKRVDKLKESGTPWGYLLGGLLIILVALSFIAHKALSKKESMAVKSNEQSEVNREIVDDFSVLNELSNCAIIELDRSDNIVRTSKTAQGWLEDSAKLGTNWQSYLKTFFYKDALSSKWAGGYRHRLYPEYLFRVSYKSNKRLVKSYVEVERLNVSEVVAVGSLSYRKDFQSDTYEVLDLALMSFSGKGCDKLPALILDSLNIKANTYQLYLNSMEARNLFLSYFLILDAVVKANSDLVLNEVKLSRDVNGLVTMNSVLDGGHLLKYDFSNDIKGGVSQRVQAIESRFEAICESVTIKNLSINHVRKVSVEVTIRDLHTYFDKIQDVGQKGLSLNG